MNAASRGVTDDAAARRARARDQSAGVGRRLAADRTVHDGGGTQRPDVNKDGEGRGRETLRFPPPRLTSFSAERRRGGVVYYKGGGRLL